jgi:hypothetical protein
VRIAIRAVGVALLERLLAQGEPPADGLAKVQRWLEAEEPAPLMLIMVRGERAMYERTVEHLYGGMPAYERLYLSLNPAISPTKARSVGLRYFNEYVEAAKLPEDQRPGRRPVLPDDPKTVPILIGLLSSSVDKIAEACVRSHAQVRCAIAAVAAERFRRDKGRWPASLDELVSAGLLKTVPRDPYDFRPLRLKRRPDGLVIYTIGPDKTDNGGVFDRQKPLEPGTDWGLQLWDVPARRQPLSPPRPPAEDPP